MRALREKIYLLPADTDQETILERLACLFDLREDDVHHGEEYYYDTFDWRLYRREMIFVAAGERVELRNFSGRVLGTALIPRAEKYFWWDIDDSPLSGRLRKAIDMRALSPLISLDYFDRQSSLLNEDGKTVVRFNLRSSCGQSGNRSMELPILVCFREIRGYENAFDTATGACREAGLKPSESGPHLFDRAFGISTREPLDYGEKLYIDLAGSVTIGEAVAKICFSLTDTMDRNLPGVLADVDSEFLHDFRIAVRRIRSLLTLLKKTLPAEQTIWFQSEFKKLGSVTGRVRDIDVYLLERDNYSQLLPPSISSGLDLFFEELEARRGVRLKDMREYLRSDRYRQLIKNWRSFLSDPQSELYTEVRSTRCRPLIGGILAKRFSRLLRDGAVITGESRNDELHQLRIKAKKIRYMFEFFRAFYHADEVDLLLKQMKKLQNNLGEFNDLSVQLSMLRSELAGLTGRSKKNIHLAAALGGLITGLTAKHHQVRSVFVKIFNSFNRKKNRHLLAAMLSEEKEPVSPGGRL